MSTKTKQRWYCPVCGCKYKASWGMMIQIVTDFETPRALDFNCRAEVPDHDIEDLKALRHERSDFRDITDPLELKKAIPDRLPCLASGTLRAARDDEVQHAAVSQFKDKRPLSYGVYILTNPQALEDLPKFAWNQIYNFAGMEPPSKKK